MTDRNWCGVNFFFVFAKRALDVSGGVVCSANDPGVAFDVDPISTTEYRVQLREAGNGVYLAPPLNVVSQKLIMRSVFLPGVNKERVRRG